MRRPTLWFAAIAGILLAVLLFLLMSRPTSVPSPQLQTAPPEGPTAQAIPSPAAAPRPVASGCVLEVTVTGTDASVPVMLIREENYENLGTWETVTTEGRATFQDLQPGYYRATADSPDHVPATMKAQKCTRVERLSATLDLKPAEAWFVGAVTDEEGRPLDAEIGIVEAGRTGVFAGPASIATTDGTYRVGVTVGTSYNLYARADGYRFGSGLTETPKRGDEVVVDFTLSLEGLVQGVVRGPDGAPVAGAIVQRHPTTTKTATSGTDGAYALASHPGQSHVLSAHLDDLYGWVEVGVVQEGEDKFGIDIPMELGRTVNGRVVHADSGEPVGPTTVMWSVREIGLLKLVPVAEDGTFVATGVPDDGDTHKIVFMIYDNARSPEPLRSVLAPDDVTIDVRFRAKE